MTITRPSPPIGLCQPAMFACRDSDQGPLNQRSDLRAAAHATRHNDKYDGPTPLDPNGTVPRVATALCAWHCSRSDDPPGALFPGRSWTSAGQGQQRQDLFNTQKTGMPVRIRDARRVTKGA
jgi:hypothetical protein